MNRTTAGLVATLIFASMLIQVSSADSELSNETRVVITSGVAANTAQAKFADMVEFANGNVFVAYFDVSDSNVYYTLSDDAGATWAPPIDTGAASSVDGVDLDRVDGTSALLCAGTVVYAVTDSGDTVTQITGFTAGTKDCAIAHAGDINTFMYAAESGSAIVGSYTDDGGDTWTTLGTVSSVQGAMALDYDELENEFVILYQTAPPTVQYRVKTSADQGVTWDATNYQMGSATAQCTDQVDEIYANNGIWVSALVQVTTAETAPMSGEFYTGCQGANPSGGYGELTSCSKATSPCSGTVRDWMGLESGVADNNPVMDQYGTAFGIQDQFTGNGLVFLNGNDGDSQDRPANQEVDTWPVAMWTQDDGGVLFLQYEDTGAGGVDHDIVFYSAAVIETVIPENPTTPAGITAQVLESGTVTLQWFLSTNDPDPVDGDFDYEVVIQGVNVGADILDGDDQDGYRVNEQIVSTGEDLQYQVLARNTTSNETSALSCSIIIDSGDVGSTVVCGSSPGAPGIGGGGGLLGIDVEAIATDLGTTSSVIGWFLGLLLTLGIAAGMYFLPQLANPNAAGSNVMGAFGIILGTGTSAVFGFFPLWFIAFLVMISAAVFVLMRGRS